MIFRTFADRSSRPVAFFLPMLVMCNIDMLWNPLLLEKDGSKINQV